MAYFVYFERKRELINHIHKGHDFMIHGHKLFHSHSFKAHSMNVGESVSVTDFPERKWSARITMTKHGLRVK